MLCYICVVDADPLFPIQLLNHYYIGEPFRIVNSSYKLGSEQFFNLFIDHCVAFRIEPSALLDDRFVRGIDVKPIDDD